MKNIIKITLLFVLISTLVSCNDFFDVNEDPTRITQDNLTLEIVLPTVLEATSKNHYLVGYNASLATHQMDQVQGDYYQRFTMSSAWSNIYLKALVNLATLEDLANEKNAPNYVAISKILTAVNVGLLTDTWEDAPFTEALQGSENVTPVFDTQESMYAEIQALLDEAIDKIELNDQEFVPGNDDIIYFGDMAKWKKLAHSLKARYMLHLSNHNPDWNAILTEANNGFTSNDDDFQMNYYAEYSNPWYQSVAKKINESIFTLAHAEYFINQMNGETYPGLIDPRLPLIADNDGELDYNGLAQWITDDTYNCLPTESSFNMSATSAIIMMSYAELNFIKAEADLNTNPGNAYTAYIEGIQANMDKLEVDSVLANTYLTDPLVANTGTVDLQHIMKEKYIATYLNPETWVDMRRHNYDANIYHAFVEPDINDRNVPGQRAEYPSFELDRNGDNAQDHIRDFTTKMWRDQ